MAQQEPAPATATPVRETRFTRGQMLALLGLLVTGIFLLDLVTPPPLDIPILYVFAVVLGLRCPWPHAPLWIAASAMLLTAVPPAVFWDFPVDWFIALNRIIAGIALGITGVLVENRRVAEAAVRESQEQLGIRVEERTTQLRAANQTLESEISARRETERTLQESLERLARTEAFSLIMVTHVGLDGRWLKIPGRLCDLLGYSEADLLGGTFMDVSHPEDVDADWSQCQRLIRGEIQSFELEKRYIRKDGEIVWVYLNCSGVYGADGRLIHFLTYIRDISDRKRMEAALRQSEEKWRSIIETVPIGIAVSTGDGRVLDCNTAAWRILGYDSKEKFLRQSAVSHYLDPADRQRRIDRIRAGDGIFETQYRKKDGSLFWGRCTAAILSEQDGQVLLITAYEDITEQRAHQDTLQRAKDELQRANERLTERDRLRTKFLSVVSHELRTPMAAIKGFVDNMLSGVTGAVSEQQAHYLTRIHSNIERLTRLIAQILDWARLEAGGLRLVLRATAPGDLLRAISENAHAMASAKQIAVDTRIETNLPTILADSDKLEQVLWNLVGNAVKFTPTGGRITIECGHGDMAGITFAVSDTGCGIPPEDLARVFDQFSGVNPPGSSGRGAQLGLYITKSLILLHGGRIRVESVPGEGSRFCVDLPLQPPETSLTASGG